MTLLFPLALLVAGALLFLVQPMFARLVLPLVGGAPSVWNTVMVCYQVLLLGSYLYAHGVTRWLSPRRQVVVHTLVLLAPLLALPIALPTASLPPAGSNPSWWVMATLLVSAGAPFFAVATTSPLVQAWAARRSGITARPYALYVASNIGSLLGLLGYPLLLEPWLSLRGQSLVWTAGYVLLVVLVLACALMAITRASARVAVSVPAAPQSARLPTGVRARWVLLAFIPSSLMLSVTMHLSTNIAPMPWLWVIPLALYLLSFIVAFAARRPLRTATLSRALPMALVTVMVALLADVSKPVWVVVGLHLAAFTVVALLSHMTLADEAPPASHLTEFYLWLSVGGALGGLVNAIVAPLLFTSVLEYPLVLVLAAFALRVERDDDQAETAPAGARWMTPQRLVDVALPLSLVPLVVLADVVTRQFGLDSVSTRRLVALGAPAIICYVLAGRQMRFGLGVAALLAGSVAFERTRQLLVAERSFFGITRVYVTGGGKYHALVHGSISHGAQSLDPARRREPLSYYTTSGPVGEVIIPRQRLGLVHRVAVVGLGAGSLACYRQPGEQWTFFEIDAAVLRIAQDPRYFSYLRDCAPDAVMRLGDARLSLSTMPDASFDLMLMDAYSADAIPVHLLTREAFALYRRTLAPGGVIAFHISNQYFALAPVIAALAKDAGMVARFRDEDILTETESARGKTTSDWMVVARSAADFGALSTLPRWSTVAPAPRVWTDDFSSTLSALR